MNHPYKEEEVVGLSRKMTEQTAESNHKIRFDLEGGQDRSEEELRASDCEARAEGKCRIIAVRLYEEQLQCDCLDPQSVRRMIDQILSKPHLDQASKVSLAIIVADQVRNRNMTCQQILTKTIQRYESLQRYGSCN